MKLSNIAGRIITRNLAENVHPYAATQEIDEMLEALAGEMEKEWWDIYKFTGTDMPDVLALQFERIMEQSEWNFF